MQFLSTYFPIILSLTLLSTFFSTILISKRKYKFETRKAFIRALLVTVAVVLVFYLIFVATVLGVISYVEETQFDQLEWNTKVNERWKMRKDIVEGKLLIGLDSMAVKETLGNPTFNKKLDNTWIYNFGGHSESLGFVFSNLQVKFKQNKVVKVSYLDTAD